MATKPDELSRGLDDLVVETSLKIGATETQRQILGPYIEHFNRLLREARGASAAAASGNPRAGIGAFRGLMVAITGIVESLEDDFLLKENEVLAANSRDAELRATIVVLEAARQKLEDALTRERESASRAIAEERLRSENVVAGRDRRIIELETLVVTSADHIIQRLRVFIRDIITKMDNILRDDNALIERLETLLRKDVQEISVLEEAAVSVVDAAGAVDEIRRPLTEEITYLGSEAAEFENKKYYKFTDADRTAVARLSARYDTVLRQYEGLNGLIETLLKERDALREANEQIIEQWRGISRDLQSALHLFPLVLEQDPFVLAGTSREAVGQKSRSYTEQQQRCLELLSQIDQILREHQFRYGAYSRSLAPVKKDIDELRRFNEIAWFQTLSIEEQQLIRAATLVFNDDDRHLSFLILRGVLAEAGVLTADDSEDRLLGALREELFAPAAPTALQDRMRLYHLTTLGQYWRETWKRSDSSLDLSISNARETWMKKKTTIKVQREEAAQQKRAAAAAEAAARAAAETARRMARENPANIIANLNPLEQRVLGVLAAVTEPERPPGDGVKILAAAIVSEIISDDLKTKIPAALKKLARNDPPLLVFSNEDEIGERFYLTSSAFNAAHLLPSLPDAQLDALNQAINTKVKFWDEKKRKLYHQLRRLLGCPVFHSA